VSDALLLDTHIAVWLEIGDVRLRPGTLQLIENCWRAGGKIYFSAVSAWEIAQLVNGARLNLDVAADVWVRRFLERPGFEGVALTASAASRSYRLVEFLRRDPGDRMLMATAIELGCRMVTYDEAMIAFAEGFGERYGFGVVF
jgi:PIN domain nuclease of toxin-antitoxin system